MRLEDRCLAGHDVRPGRAERVLEVGHEDARPGVEGVDRHLGLGRAGDLDAPIVQVGRGRRDPPVGSADIRGLGQEVGPLPAGQPRGALGPGGEDRGAALAELALEAGHEAQRVVAQDVGVLGCDGREDLDAVGRRHSIGLQIDSR